MKKDFVHKGGGSFQLQTETVKAEQLVYITDRDGDIVRLPFDIFREMAFTVLGHVGGTPVGGAVRPTKRDTRWYITWKPNGVLHPYGFNPINGPLAEAGDEVYEVTLTRKWSIQKEVRTVAKEVQL